MTSASPLVIPHNLSRRETLRSLKSQLGRVSFQDQSHAVLRGSVLDSLLPEGRLREGSLVELLSPRAGSGVWELAFHLVKHLQQEQFTPVLIDNQQEFFPPGAAELGVDLNRLIVVQPRSLTDQLWAIEQTLRCEGKAVVLSPLGRVPSTTYRRLKLAAERGKGLGLFIRDASVRSSPSWADLRVLVDPVRSSSRLRQYRVWALNSLEGTASQSLLERCDDSGALSLVSQLANSTQATAVFSAS